MRVYGNFRGASADNPGALGPITAFVVRPVQDHNEVRTCRHLASRVLRGDSELVTSACPAASLLGLTIALAIAMFERRVLRA